MLQLTANKISYIDNGATDKLKKVEKLDLHKNDCIDEEFFFMEIKNDSVVFDVTVHFFCQEDYKLSSDEKVVHWSVYLVISIVVAVIVLIIGLILFIILKRRQTTSYSGKFFGKQIFEKSI